MLEELRKAAAFLRERIGEPPKLAAVLGSGLGDAFLSKVDVTSRLSYRQIPHFPASSVVGHAGVLGWGESEGVRFCALLGRVHLYEGPPLQRIVFAVRALALWGVQNFIITNAAGAVNRKFAPGDLMLITDHINLQGDNPLTGDNQDELGPRFPDMSCAYHQGLRQTALESAQELGQELRQGVYAALRGPSYETPAEIRMCEVIGADAVGMSTVPEVIALNHMGRRVMGISCLTNMAAGILDQPLIHDEVLQITRQVQGDFSRLIVRIIGKLNSE
ncbi:MAG: purine-nucleoside phosphorylase [Acidobacteriota bacterium]